MSKHSRELRERQEALAATLERNHRDLTTKVEELTPAVKVTTSTKEAGATAAGITPLKGESYATGIHQVMEQIAVGLGDEYADTSAIPGAIPRNKKGDGGPSSPTPPRMPRKTYSPYSSLDPAASGMRSKPPTTGGSTQAAQTPTAGSSPSPPPGSECS